MFWKVKGGCVRGCHHIRLVSVSPIHSITVTCLLITSAPSWGPSSQCVIVSWQFKVVVRRFIAGHVKEIFSHMTLRPASCLYTSCKAMTLTQSPLLHVLLLFKFLPLTIVHPVDNNSFTFTDFLYQGKCQPGMTLLLLLPQFSSPCAHGSRSRWSLAQGHLSGQHN